MLKVLLESQGHNGVDGVAYHPYTRLVDGGGAFDLYEKVSHYNRGGTWSHRANSSTWCR